MSLALVSLLQSRPETLDSLSSSSKVCHLLNAQSQYQIRVQSLHVLLFPNPRRSKSKLEFAAYMFPSLPCAKAIAKGTMS
jgi:hypothetical protein